MKAGVITLPGDALGAQPSLADWLEFNAAYVEAEAPKVEPHGDLSPMLIAHNDDGPVTLICASWDSSEEKVAIFRAFAAYLKHAGANRYATITAAWMVDMSSKQYTPEEVAEMTKRIDAEGTAAYPDLRRECYQIAVGDKTKTLMQTLMVKRSEGGRIIGLERMKEIPGDSSVDLITGRLVDLLREPQA